MQPDTLMKLIAGSAPALAALLTLGQLVAFRAARERRSESMPGVPPKSAGVRFAPYAFLIALSVAAFPIGFYTFALSLVVPPWQIFWAVGAAMVLSGLAGLITAIVMHFRFVKRPLLIYAVGAADLALMAAAWFILAAYPKDTEMPAPMKHGVRTNREELQKRLFLSVPGLGPITDIEHGEIRAPRRDERSNSSPASHRHGQGI